MCKFPVRKTSLLVVLALVDGFVFVMVCLLCAMDFPSDLSGKKIIKLIDHIDHAYYCWASYIYIIFSGVAKHSNCLCFTLFCI